MKKDKMEEFIEKSKLYFWQYPVITEKIFFKQNKDKNNFLGFPWATVLDKRLTIYHIYRIVSLIHKSEDTYTCCQHISFRKLLGLFKTLNIKVLYTPHKIKNEDILNGIEIRACPLYAVNIEDPKRNLYFKDKDYINCKRKYLFSFMGGYDKRGYLTTIRERIFKMKDRDDIYIKNTGGWHFDSVVYSNDQNNKGVIIKTDKNDKNKENYNELLLNSRYSLCPSGSGPNSIRLWESLAIGTIPIILSDNLELPQHELWKDTIINIKESDLEDIYKILENISIEKEEVMKENCIKIYNYFRDNYRIV